MSKRPFNIKKRDKWKASGEKVLRHLQKGKDEIKSLYYDVKSLRCHK